MTDLLQSDPFQQFELWYQEAVANELDPNAMLLATADRQGRPSARVVLYKGMDANAICVYTNYRSRKAREMLENPQVSLVFYWPKLYRQIRIEGHAERMSAKDSEAYFLSRPYESQISAWASPQSEDIPDREYLIAQHQEVSERFAKEKIYCPEFWGGFRINPEHFEFWIGREHRLHDRFYYSKSDQGWVITRLAP